VSSRFTPLLATADKYEPATCVCQACNTRYCASLLGQSQDVALLTSSAKHSGNGAATRIATLHEKRSEKLRPLSLASRLTSKQFSFCSHRSLTACFRLSICYRSSAEVE